MALEPIGPCAAVEYGDPSHLVILIRSHNPPGGPREFSFQRFGDRLRQTKLYVADPTYPYSLYMKGLTEIAENHDEIVEFLQFFIKRIGAERVTLIAASIGAPPAVAWGVQLGADDVHLIGGVPDLELCLQQERADAPFFKPQADHFRSMIDDYPYANSREVLLENPDAVRCIDVYYGLDDPIDRAQSETLIDLPNVRRTVYHQGNHARLPIFVLSRDPDLQNRIMDPVVADPAELRKSGNGPMDLGYAEVWPA